MSSKSIAYSERVLYNLPLYMASAENPSYSIHFDREGNLTERLRHPGLLNGKLEAYVASRLTDSNPTKVTIASGNNRLILPAATVGFIGATNIEDVKQRLIQGVTEAARDADYIDTHHLLPQPPKPKPAPGFCE